MNGMIFIAACLLLGMSLAWQKAIPERFTASLNALAIQVSLPALVLRSLHEFPLDYQVLLPFSMPWVVFAITALAVQCVSVIRPLDRSSTACLTLVCGTGNTSIIGIPLVTAYLGSAAVGAAVVADQSNFIVLCTLGMWSVATGTGERWDLRAVLRQMFQYRPQQAMLLALLLRPLPFPPWLDKVLADLGATLTPIAVISVGAGLLQHRGQEGTSTFMLGVVIKLLLVPACVFGLYSLVASPDPTIFSATVLQAAMPPMIIAGLIAVDKNLNPALAMRLIALGIPISFVTTVGWSFWLRHAG